MLYFEVQNIPDQVWIDNEARTADRPPRARNVSGLVCKRGTDMTSISRVLAIAAAVSVLAGWAMAQTASTGALTGTVTDPAGASAPNVTVTATNEGSGQER